MGQLDALVGDQATSQGRVGRSCSRCRCRATDACPNAHRITPAVSTHRPHHPRPHDAAQIWITQHRRPSVRLRHLPASHDHLSPQPQHLPGYPSDSHAGSLCIPECDTRKHRGEWRVRATPPFRTPTKASKIPDDSRSSCLLSPCSRRWAHLTADARCAALLRLPTGERCPQGRISLDRPKPRTTAHRPCAPPNPTPAPCISHQRDRTESCPQRHRAASRVVARTDVGGSCRSKTRHAVFVACTACRRGSRSLRA